MTWRNLSYALLNQNTFKRDLFLSALNTRQGGLCCNPMVKNDTEPKLKMTENKTTSHDMQSSEITRLKSQHIILPFPQLPAKIELNSRASNEASVEKQCIFTQNILLQNTQL